MKTYRIYITIEDQVSAEDRFHAFTLFLQRLGAGYYGPTMEEIEEIEETIPTETYEV